MQAGKSPFLTLFTCGVVVISGVGLCGYEFQQLLFTHESRGPITTIAINQKPVKDTLLEIFSRPWSITFVQARQRDKSKQLMATGRYESALEAAKSYYNVAEVSKTADAVKLIAAILGRERGKPTANEFRREQGIVSGTRNGTESVFPSQPILSTLKVDSSCYESKIEELESEPENFDSMMGCGNLLLLSDSPRDARPRFEFALQIADGEEPERPQRTAAALEGIVRTIRDEDGYARRADGFIRSLQSAALPITATNDCPAARIHAAAMKTALSGIFVRDSTSTHFEYPEDPSVKACNDPKLASWLSRWQEKAFSSNFVESTKSELLDLLNKSSLSSMELLSVGRSISIHSTDDWIAAALYAEAAMHADIELKQTSGTSLPTRQLLVAMTLAKSTLWRVVDEGDQTFLDQLFTLNRDLANNIPSNDQTMRNARIHGFIGAAECLWLRGKYSEAKDTLSPLDTLSLTIEQERAAAWIRGLISLSTNRYADARVQFQIVVNSPDFLYTERAYRWLIVCLAHTGKTAQANEVFDHWVRKFHPTTELAARVLELMDDNGMG
jgi:hypothetical protein